MNQEPSINFRQYMTPRKNKKFLVKFAFYALVLGVLSYIVSQKISVKKTMIKNPTEIRGVKILVE
jgi:hypothetical protein